MHKRKTEKYDFEEALQPYTKQKVVLIPGVVSVLQKLMGILYFLEKDDTEIKVTSKKISLSDDTKIRVLIYEPQTHGKNLPCMFFLHGGGFVFNAAPHHFKMARRFTKELQIKTVLIDYRLAPKYKFPTAPKDCFAVYKWILENSTALGINPERVMVCGDSAGGNLAAVLCLMARDYGITLPKLQMLLYPVTDRRMITQSYKKYTDTPMCNSRDMEKYLEMYGKNVDGAGIPYLSPIEAASFEKVPPAYMEVAQYDCLHDEGVMYAEALEQAGISVTLKEIPGAMHGYDIAQDSPFVGKIMEERVNFIREKL